MDKSANNKKINFLLDFKIENKTGFQSETNGSLKRLVFEVISWSDFSVLLS